MKSIHWLLLLSMLLSLAGNAAAQTPADYTVQVSATVQSSPAQVRLEWPLDNAATGYTVYRKAKGAIAWGAALFSLPGTATSVADTTVNVGEAWEYRVFKSASGHSGNGYAYVGVEAPAQDDYGKLVLVVDTTVCNGLSAEVAQLTRDLWGDGWQVVRLDVDRSDSVPAVKARIQALWQADPGRVRSVLLLGHVPVPYSGNLNPDGHPEHQGAWPADVYYGEMNGAWTDATVNNTSAARPENQNTIGDGKFDQSALPSDMELEVGRIDMANLPAFSQTEEDLLRQYLDRDHGWRHKAFTVADSGVVDDNFGVFGGENFAANGWRNMAPMVGAGNVVAGDFRTELNARDLLWAYGCGGGWYEGASGVGSSQDFATDSLRAVFTMLFGSYHGDWDSQNNFMRTALAAKGHVLACAWAGRPHWYFHHMGLGEPIGYSARLTQGNFNTYPTNYGGRFIHIALLGDPALRMHVCAPPRDLVVTATGGGSVHELHWSPSPDAVTGYRIYRQDTLDGRYWPLATTQDTMATVACVEGGSYRYMVRAEELRVGHSGSYYNLSQGLIDSIDGNPVFLPEVALASPATYCLGDSLRIPFTTQADHCPGNQFMAEISDSTGDFSATTIIGILGGTVGDTIDAVLPPGLPLGTGYRIRVRSTMPAVVGPDNGGDLTLETVPVASVSLVPSGVTLTLLDGSVGAMGGICYWGDGDSSQWAGTLTHTYVSIDSFLITYVVFNGCGSDTAILAYVPLGTTEATLGQPVFLSPNPAGDWAELRVGRPLGGRHRLQVHDLLGHCIYATDWTGTDPHRIALSDWPRGTYVVSLTGKSGTWRRRLVVQ